MKYLQMAAEIVVLISGLAVAWLAVRLLVLLHSI